jgi:magnesium chelatase subunit I
LIDRIGSEIRTHYPATRQHAMAITSQEAWIEQRGCDVTLPQFVREVVEEVAFQARQDSKIDKRSGVSQRLPISLLENVVSSAERRALQAREPMIVPRVTDIYAALPAITGKFELEYEGELRGADNVARDIIRSAVGNVFSGYFAGVDLKQVTDWFDLGGSLQIDDTLPAAELLERAAEVQGLREVAATAGLGERPAAPLAAAAIDFVLEGLYAQKKISRSDEFQYQGAEQPRRPARPSGADQMLDRDIQIPGNKKKYYN